MNHPSGHTDGRKILTAFNSCFLETSPKPFRAPFTIANGDFSDYIQETQQDSLWLAVAGSFIQQNGGLKSPASNCGCLHVIAPGTITCEWSSLDPNHQEPLLGLPHVIANGPISKCGHRFVASVLVINRPLCKTALLSSLIMGPL